MQSEWGFKIVDSLDVLKLVDIQDSNFFLSEPDDEEWEVKICYKGFEVKAHLEFGLAWGLKVPDFHGLIS